jgi:uncharacterized protein (TIGR03066 family)
MRRSALILGCAALIIGCGDDDDNPVAPEVSNAELVGTWLLIASTDLTEQELSEAERIWTMEQDGTLISTFRVDDVSLRATGTWSVSGGKLIATFEFDGETQTLSETFTIEDNKLNIVADDGSRVTYERR